MIATALSRALGGLALGVTVGLAGGCGSSPAESIETRAAVVFDAIDQGGLTSAIPFLWFPEDSTGSPGQREDREVTASTLRIIEEEVGPIRQSESRAEIESFDGYLEIGAGGGEGEYWERTCSRNQSVGRTVRIAQEQGIVRLVYCQIGDAWVLRFVSVGIVPSSAEARGKVDRATRRVEALLRGR
jgi:hypothetical protein